MSGESLKPSPKETEGNVQGQELEKYLQRFNLGHSEVTPQHIKEKLTSGEITSEQAITILSELSDWLRKESRTDELTGLANRRGFDEGSREMLASLVPQETGERREGAPEAIIVALADLSLKEINDKWGHAVGDQALVQVAKAIQDSIRYGDLAARVGGDEFCILMPILVQEAETGNIEERLRNSLKNITLKVFDKEEEKTIPVKVALGLSSVNAEEMRVSPDLASAINQADQAMYRDKNEG